jgi:hypothetical protein
MSELFNFYFKPSHDFINVLDFIMHGIVYRSVREGPAISTDAGNGV